MSSASHNNFSHNAAVRCLSGSFALILHLSFALKFFLNLQSLLPLLRCLFPYVGGSGFQITMYMIYTNLLLIDINLCGNPVERWVPPFSSPKAFGHQSTCSFYSFPKHLAYHRASSAHLKNIVLHTGDRSRR